jgi:short-subunit dehydrogenase
VSIYGTSPANLNFDDGSDFVFCRVEDDQRLMNTNYFAPLNIIRHVLPSMRARKSGTIVNISSSAGVVALPACGVYAASKHALEGPY